MSQCNTLATEPYQYCNEPVTELFRKKQNVPHSRVVILEVDSSHHGYAHSHAATETVYCHRRSTCQGCWSVPPNLDEDFESFRQNSKYFAFQESLEKMKNFDSLLDLYYDLGDPQQLLLDEELRERFCQTDFKVMRVAFWTVAIPPPKN